jgi:hypothetical protein
MLYCVLVDLVPVSTEQPIGVDLEQLFEEEDDFVDDNNDDDDDSSNDEDGNKVMKNMRMWTLLARR